MSVGWIMKKLYSEEEEEERRRWWWWWWLDLMSRFV